MWFVTPLVYGLYMSQNMPMRKVWSAFRRRLRSASRGAHGAAGGGIGYSTKAASPRPGGSRAQRAARPSRGCKASDQGDRMALSIGIVGLPNVGKSTLFTALTRNVVDAANYPFATIEPNVGVVAVPDCAPRQARRDGPPRAHRSRHRRVRRHRRARARSERGGGPGQPVPREHPRVRRDRRGGAVLRRRERHPRRGQGRSGERRRHDQDRARARGPRHDRARAAEAREGRQEGRGRGGEGRDHQAGARVDGPGPPRAYDADDRRRALGTCATCTCSR